MIDYIDSLWDLMRALRCGECGAGPSEPCRNEEGEPVALLHPARYAAAKRHLREP